MITFLSAIALLIVGYIVYGRIIERIFGSDPKRETPAYSQCDGIDYTPMKPWRIFMIQFLNIAGLGPIFGAIMGAKFGVASYLWIVFGCIFGGAVHDYLSGMISLRENGASLPEIHGKYLGRITRQSMRAFTIILMILVGAVFVSGPAALLADLTPGVLNFVFWVIVIFIYYLLATLLPIDKIIGKVYPFFGICLLFMAFGIFAAILYFQPTLPEIWDGIANKHPQAEGNPIFPMMFISIACGAVSGFHATQSPLMARCMTNERYGRPIFYGAMIAEGIVALIWAAAASYFFFDTPEGAVQFTSGTNAAVVVHHICNSWLGTFGALLAIFGVIAAPITSGDTAFRSARLILADLLHYDQKPLSKRLFIAIPLFIVGLGVLLFSLYDKDGFGIIWACFSCANQILAMITFWAITSYLFEQKKCYWVALLPAIFMTLVCTTFIFIDKNTGFGLPHGIAYACGGFATLVICGINFYVIGKRKRVKSAGL